MSSIHLDLLDKKRRTVFERLKVFKEATLAGGTALMLQIAHRKSFDFDLFLERGVGKEDFQELKRVFKIKVVDINTSDQLTVRTSDKVSVTLVHCYYKPLLKRVPTPSLSLYAVKDIAADKAHTIGRRAVWRDYVDLFFILKGEHTDIFELIKLAKQKFGVEFNPKLFLEQLVYFKDLEISEIAFVKEKYSPRKIQNFLKQKVKKFKSSEFKS